ncbi:MAG: hypothetical protein ACXWUL_06585, partial [Caldimonas sp.]
GARAAIVAGLENGCERFGLALACNPALRKTLLDDASGDRLDAVLCLAQAAIASRRERYGAPERVDPVEGWIAADGRRTCAGAGLSRRGTPKP